MASQGHDGQTAPPEELTGELERLRKDLESRAAEFERSHGRRYQATDLQADPEWNDAQQAYRKLSAEHAEHLAASSGVECRQGQCRFFISRRRRYCSNMASVGSVEGLCSDHSKVEASSKVHAAESSRERDGKPSTQIEDARSKRKYNMARPPKHMLNPFKCQEAAPPEEWDKIYGDLTRPLLLDVGCAKGRWLEELAEENPVRLELNGQRFNYLGVELYAPLATMANQRVAESNRTRAVAARNVHFIGANIMTSLRSLAMPNLHTVCIQFPDPWIKKRKRRVVTDEFARQLGELLPAGGQLYVSSDYQELAVDMRATFLATGLFRLVRSPACEVLHVGGEDETSAVGKREPAPSPPSANFTCLPSVVTWTGNHWCDRPSLRWLPERPLVLGTERDQVCEVTWRPSYRCLFVRER